MKELLQFLPRVVRITFLNIKSNWETSWVSMATITVAFSLLGLFLLILVNLNVFLSTWNRQIQLIIYLEDNISKNDQAVLEKLIAKNQDVKASLYVSREKAWENFKKTFSGKAIVLRGLDFNPLPASLNLNFKDSSNRIDSIRQFSMILEKQNGVESLEYGEKWISRFETFMVFLRLFLLAIGGVLGLGLILIVSNTIKLSIYSRKEEIELMYLIGARPQFIKFPFLMEGMVQGFLGALASIVIINFVHLYMKTQFAGTFEFLRGINVQFISTSLVLLMVFSSMLIGWVGSLLAIKKFVVSKVKE